MYTSKVFAFIGATVQTVTALGAGYLADISPLSGDTKISLGLVITLGVFILGLTVRVTMFLQHMAELQNRMNEDLKTLSTNFNTHINTCPARFNLRPKNALLEEGELLLEEPVEEQK